MKVLMINVSCGTGSTGRICTDLATTLEEKGHEVKIAYGRDKVNSQFTKYAIKIGTDLEVKLHALYARLFDASGLGSKHGTRKFIKWAREYNPDIIHLHNIHGYFLHIPTLFKYLKECGKPIIWTLHDCWAFTGHTAFCDSANCDRWKIGCGLCPLLSQYPKSYIDQSKRNWKWKRECFTDVPNMLLVTPSKWLAGLLKQSFMKGYQADVIHNGIDTSVFFPLKNDFKEYYDIREKKVLLGVADIWNEKNGIKDFIKLSALIDSDTVIVMVGLTKEQIKELPSNVIGIERISSAKELNLIYSSADVLIELTYCDNYTEEKFYTVSCQIPKITYESTNNNKDTDREVIVVKKGDIERVWAEAQLLMSSDRMITVNNTKKIDYVDFYKNEKHYCGYFEEKSKRGLSGKYIILGVASVWDRRKGLDDFISLYRQISDNEFIVVLIGLSEAQIRELPNGIQGIQRTESIDELRKLYGIADVFFNPTIEDNYPTTNIEAACCGTPTITYRTGGSPESVVETQVVNKNDLDSVIQLIKRTNLQILMNEDYDKQNMGKHYLSIYDKMLIKDYHS